MSAATKRKSPQALSSLQRREISLAAMVDERTLKRALRGEPVQAMPRERIRRALDARGLVHLLPDEPGPTRAA
jgi:hypothetical protein